MLFPVFGHLGKHIVNKYSVSGPRIVDEHMSYCAHKLSVLYYRTAAHSLYDTARAFDKPRVGNMDRKAFIAVRARIDIRYLRVIVICHVVVKRTPDLDFTVMKLVAHAYPDLIRTYFRQLTVYTENSAIGIFEQGPLFSGRKVSLYFARGFPASPL